MRCPNCGMKECCGAYMSEEIAETTARAERLQAELVKAEGERDRLAAAFEVREWTREMNRAWHLCIPDIHKAFKELKRAALGGLNG